MPREFNLSPEAAVQYCEVCTLRGFWWGKAALNDALVIQVMEVPVSNNHEKVFPPALAISQGRILSPLRGVF